MTEIPSTPPPPGAPAPEQGGTDTRVFRRNPDGPIGGVATGIADYLGVDPTIVKVAVAIAIVVSQGVALLAYVGAWALIPTKHEDTSTKRFVTRQSVSTPSMAVLVVGLIVGVAIVVDAITDPGTSLVVPGLLLLGGYYFLNQRSGGSATAVAPPPPHATAATGNAYAMGTFTPPPPGTASPPPPSAASTDPYAWAVPKVADDPSPSQQPRHEPSLPEAPTPPITAVTLAAAAGGIALLALLDGLAGTDLGSAAYIGLATAIIGGGMIVASVMGRARALIPLGLLSVSSLVVAPIIDTAVTGGFGAREIAVSNEAALQDVYTLGAGAFEIDLSALTLTEDRTVELDIGAGAAQIRIPSDLNVEIVASNWAGYIGAVAPFERPVDGATNEAGDDPDATAALEEPNEDLTFGFDEDGDFSIEIDGFEIEGRRVEAPIIPIPGSVSSWPTEEVAGVDSNYRWTQRVDDGPTLTIVANLTYGAIEVIR